MFAPSMRTVCGGLVPGALVEGREDRRVAEKRAAEKLAAEKLLRNLIRKQSRTPCVWSPTSPVLMALPGPGWA